MNKFTSLIEIESALVSCTELVAEAAVVGRPDETTGEAICAFVVLKRPFRQETKARPLPNNCAITSPKKLAPLPSLKTFALERTCLRLVPAKSCAACCAAWPKARKLRKTLALWKTQPFWANWVKRIELNCKAW